MPFVRRDGQEPVSPGPPSTRRVFVGRASEIQFFRRRILEPDLPDHNIVCFHGQGGVGKSTLLGHLEDVARSTSPFRESCRVAHVDERQPTPADVMESFATQLGIMGDIGKALGSYREALRRLDAEHEQARETLGRKATTAIAGTAARAVPVVGPLLGLGAEQVSELLWDEVAYRQHRKEASTSESPIQGLTRAFVSGINGLTGRRRAPVHRVLLCFDTFEYAASEIAPWLLDTLLQEDIDGRVVLVVAGRQELSRSTPADPKRWLAHLESGALCQLELGTLSRDETSAYLAARGVNDAGRTDQIWQLSRGLPLYLSMLTVRPDGEIDPTADVVHNFLRWIPEAEEKRRRLVLDGALLSRPFNRDDLRAFAYVGDDELMALHRWLLLQPFVRGRSDGRHVYHETAREMFGRYLFTSSPEGCRETRRSLAGHYRRELDAIEAAEGERAAGLDEWLEPALALVSQLLFLPEPEEQAKAAALAVTALATRGGSTRRERIGQALRALGDDHLLGMGKRARRLRDHLTAFSLGAIESTEALIETLRAHPQPTSDALASVYATRGDRLDDLGRLNDALAAYDEAIRLNPRSARVWYDKGVVAHLLSRNEEALLAFDMAVEIHPRYADALYGRSIVLQAVARREEAAAAFEQALAVVSSDPSAAGWYGRGRMLRALRRWAEALAAFDRVIELDPRYDGVWHERGDALIELRRYDEALVSLDRALTIAPENAAYWTTRGYVLHEVRRFDEAVTSFNEALAIDPQFHLAWHNRGCALVELGRLDEAIASLDGALAIDPEYASSWRWRGRALRQLRREEEALECFSRSADLTRKPPLAPDLVADDYLDTEVVIMLQGNNVHGQLAYFYLKTVGRDLRDLFVKVQLGENYNPAEFGTVLVSGLGDPPPEVVEQMAREYDMVSIALGADRPLLLPKSRDEDAGWEMK